MVGNGQMASNVGGRTLDAAVQSNSNATVTVMQAASHDSERGHGNDLSSPTISNSSVHSPPYWMTTGDHQRSRSADSILPAGAITLQDNDTTEHDDRNNACWARSVDIVDYTVVNGGNTGIGAFVVWNVRVETLTGSFMNIRKRYSEFDDFRSKLVKTFPNFEAALPPLPSKSLVSKFRPKFLETRRTGLQYFLNCVLLNPEFSGSPVLKEFLFS